MIEAVNLTKTFGPLKALDNVSCKIGEGSVFGLVGSNGSGKSTLLRLISGVYRAETGEILVDGVPVYENPEIKSSVFFLGDSPYFIHNSNLFEMAKFYKMVYSRFSDERFKYLTTVFPIDPKKRISAMSKGMQRQAALMLALSSMPDFLLLDEAFDGLDPVIRQVLKKLLATGITENNLTVIIASHNLRELEDLCDHVGLLHKGKILFNEELDKLKGNLHKVQIAFNMVPDTQVFSALEVLKIEQQGSLLRLIVRGDLEETVMPMLRSLNPLFLEAIPLTLEEIFIYELEVTGYDVKNIIK